MSIDRPAMTVPKFAAAKAAGQKLTVVTAYDYPTARLVDAAGVEGILVGDSLGMVVQGHATTLPVTLDEIIYHAEMVARAAEQALVIVDLPFPSFHLGAVRAIRAAARILKETRAAAVKLEGGEDQAETVAALVRAGIPVMGHCGLRPQNVHRAGGYRVERNREQLLADARAMEQAGAFSLVLECIPAAVAGEITGALRIPTIGIGAGAACDGQVLVFHDLVGLLPAPAPRHAKRYAELGGEITAAVTRFRDEVRDGGFPTDAQSFR